MTLFDFLDKHFLAFNVWLFVFVSCAVAAYDRWVEKR